MMMDKETIKHIAQLSRLKLEDKDEQKLGKDLVSILDYIDQLKKVDVSQVELGEEAEVMSLRKDEAQPPLSEADQLLSLAPSRQDRYIKVQSIFKHES